MLDISSYNAYKKCSKIPCNFNIELSSSYINMELVVKLCDNGTTEEWGIIELQGEIATNSRSYESLHIGDLHYNNTGRSANIIIGHHLLTGAVQEVDPPLAVLKRDEDGYVVQALIKKKLIFKNRPKPLMST